MTSYKMNIFFYVSLTIALCFSFPLYSQEALEINELRHYAQREFDKIMREVASGKDLEPKEVDNLFRALENGAKPTTSYSFYDLVDHVTFSRNTTIKDSNGNNLLHWAVSQRGIAPTGKRIFDGFLLSYLIEKSNPTLKNNLGETVLDIADSNRENIPAWIFGELVKATRGEPSSYFQGLLDANIEQLRQGKILEPVQVDNLFRALERGARTNLYSFIDILGSDVNTMKDSRGNTFLHFAANNPNIFSGSSLIAVFQGRGIPISYLIRKGADPTIKNKAGKTPVDILETQRSEVHSSVLKELIRATRSASNQSTQGNTKLKIGGCYD